MHWQHLSAQYDELSYCFDGLPHESSSTIFASSKRISKLGWLAIYTQWVQILYEEGFFFIFTPLLLCTTIPAQKGN